MGWVNHGRGPNAAAGHGTGPTRAPTVHASKRSVNLAIATDAPMQHDVMAMHRVPTRRSPDPAKLDGFRSIDGTNSAAMEDAFELRIHHSSDSARSVLESGWDAATSRVVFSRNKHTRRARRSSCPARAQPGQPRRAAGLVAADTFLSSLEAEIAAAGVDHDRRSRRQLRVLSREEERKLFILVTRCTSHGVRYRGDVAAVDVKALAAAMSVSSSSAESIMEQASRAHEILIRFNIRLVAALAKKYARSGFSVPHLMSEATHGLSDAIDRFDLTRDCKFSSFAFHYILRDIRRCIVTESRSILLPPSAHYKLSKLLKAKEDILARLPVSEREALREEFRSNPESLYKALAVELAISEAVVASLLKAGLPAFDLDAPKFDSSDDSWADYATGTNMGTDDDVHGSDASDYEAEVRQQVALSSLESLLATLDARERNILRLRYGLNAEGRTVTYAEIATAYSLSTERVRQICDAAVRKLSKPWRQEFLQEQSKDLL